MSEEKKRYKIEDFLFKEILAESIKMFLKNFLGFDVKKIWASPKELLPPQTERKVDLLFKADIRFTENENFQTTLIHIEHQSSNDKRISLRLPRILR